MKTIINFCITTMLASGLQIPEATAQSFDEARMNRDIEVAENVLTTLIKHELSDQRTFFGLDIAGTYQPGYGVTFRLPLDHTLPFAVTIEGNLYDGARVISNGRSFRYTYNGNDTEARDPNAITLKEKAEITADSIRTAYSDRMLKAAQDFILDYGEMISQLGPEEKIVVTNQQDRPNFYFNTGTRSRVTVEGKRADITALKQGKISRAEALKRLTVINTESVEAREPDLEMLSSIFSRLYRPDLSTTYFTEGNVYYERLRDFGSVFYMQMVSSVEKSLNQFFLPTLGLQNLDQEARDRKVAELYPAFEAGLKENILEYGRTVKSLKDDERLIFNVSLTKCQGCGIPVSLELSIEGAVLKAFDAGRIDKQEALKKFTVKKGMNQ